MKLYQFNKSKLQRKFFIPLVSIFSAIFLISSIIQFNLQSARLMNTLENSSRSQIELYHLVIQNPLYTFNFEQIDIILKSFLIDQNVFSVEIYDEQDILLDYQYKITNIPFDIPTIKKMSGNTVDLTNYFMSYNKEHMLLKNNIIIRELPDEIKNLIASGYKEYLLKYKQRLLIKNKDVVQDGKKIGLARIIFTKDKINLEIRDQIIGLVIQNLLIILSILVLNSFLLNYSIIKPIKILEESSGRIAEGDLTRNFDIKSRDEIGDLSHSFNHFINKLHFNISTIKKSIVQLDNASLLIFNSAAALAKRNDDETSSFEQILSTVEEFSQLLNNIKNNVIKQVDIIELTTSSMEGLFSSIQLVADRTQNIKKETDNSFESAKTGRLNLQSLIQGISNINIVMHEVDNKIKDIAKFSESIDGILKSIQEIAEQSNMLAMNASIESAHAGEYGKGFAIVADEIRNLSENSSSSVRTIGEILGTIKLNIKEAIEISNKGEKASEYVKKMGGSASKTIEDIISNIEYTSVIYNEISHGTEEQRKNGTQLLQNVEKLKQFSQEIKNSIQEQSQSASQIVSTMSTIAETRQETAEASRKLDNLAENLKTENNSLSEIVSYFKINEEK